MMRHTEGAAQRRGVEQAAQLMGQHGNEAPQEERVA
jgi:hypothetical protein